MKQAERSPRGGAKWPMIIVSMLLLNIAVCAVTVIAALSSPADIEPNYYDRASRWDETRGDAASQQAKEE